MLDMLVLQDESSHEIRTAIKAAMLMDVAPRLVRSNVAGLSTHQQALAGGRAMPVGSVEFVRMAMQVAGVPEPAGISYPPELIRLLCRDVRQILAGEVLGRWFVKPVRTKLFTGFIFDTMQDPQGLSKHDREQFDVFMDLDAGEPVWISEPVQFLCEWRYYVQDGAIVGKARYDLDGAEDAPEPDLAVVEQAIALLAFRHPCALDMGVLADGQTALVEVNDAWAIGLYGEAMSAAGYLRYLAARWKSIMTNCTALY